VTKNSYTGTYKIGILSQPTAEVFSISLPGRDLQLGTDARSRHPRDDGF